MARAERMLHMAERKECMVRQQEEGHGGLDDLIACRPQGGQGLRIVFFFYEDVVGVVGGYGKDPNGVLCQDRREPGENAD